MKKKLITTILILLGMAVLGFALLVYLGLYKDQESGILIESEPSATVFINEEEVGRTPYEANKKLGEITLRIKPDQLQNQVLDDYETKITLVPGVRTIVKRSFKESEEFSSGVVVSFEKLGGTDSYVTVVSVPDNAQILIDGKVYGYTPKRIKVTAGDHDLVVSADKYLEKSLPIRVYSGYKLTASVKLAKSEASVLDEKSDSTDELLPNEDKDIPAITIDKTDVGFLRVRSGAGTNFSEVAQVKPGEVYDVIEENEYGSWYKIKTGEVEGWVSAEFTSKVSNLTN